MIDPCNFPGCNRMMESNGYCIAHQLYATGPIAKKPKAKIQTVSAKQKDIKKELAKQYGIFLAKPENDKCKVKIDEGCTVQATVVHHVKGRLGDQVFEQKDWLPSCPHCNIELENKDALARQLGVKQSKFSKEEI